LRLLTNLHPAVVLVYIVSLLGVVMFTRHPLVIALALMGSVLFLVAAVGMQAAGKVLGLSFLLILLVTLTNPLFMHRGVTPLFVIFGKVVTMESLMYGFVSGAMLAAVILWFKGIGTVMTSDKFLYLFGRIFPKLSLILSMSFRFIPLFARQIRGVYQVQKTMGMYDSRAISDRFLGGARVFSAVLTWALENAIDTANSMRARGYGIPGRTSFSLFAFGKTDGIALIVALILGTSAALGAWSGALDFTYYPAVSAPEPELADLAVWILIGVMMLLPAMIEIADRMLWNLYRSRM